MGKLNKDIPQEQRAFFKVFEEIAYRHEYSTVFDDYLTMIINFFANGEQQELRDQALKKYSDQEKQLFNEMFKAHIAIQNDKIITKGLKWYDSLGDIYQTISSSSKSSAMGQFFTPTTAVDFMAQIISPDDIGYQMISEPCAGSGRMVLAMHAIQTLNFYWAVDLDGICAKMTAINMCLHNAAGVVTHGNTLTLEYYKHYIITRVKVGDNYLPYLKIGNDEESNQHLFDIQNYAHMMRKVYLPKENLSKIEATETELSVIAPITEIQEIIKPTISITNEQLSLF